MEKIKTQEVWVLKEGIDLDNPLVIAHPMVALQKHTDKYLLSKEEIIKLVGDAFGSGRWYQQKYPNYPDKQTYIDNLFK